ncbi:MAG: hypothetical protein IT279_11845 [Ignavibacteriaceae bacterium]|nr:hypothetical protein [Ignavibacteriaceae bacterium]
MKNIVFALVILLFSGFFETEAGNRYSVSFNVFYNQLSPHGRWIELDDNLVVWKPARHFRSFKPYHSGRWIWTNYGWYWDSFEPFGNVVYHYGRWMYDNYYGWVWVPDYEWAPAWVEWSYDDDYIGWAPMRPLITINIRYNYYYDFNKYRYRDYNFVRYRDFGSHRVQDRILRDNDNERYYNNARMRSEVTRDRDRIVNNGFDRDFVRSRGASVDDESRIQITGRDARNADELVTKDRSVINVRTINRDETEVRDRKDINIEKRESRDGDVLRNRDESKYLRENVRKDETRSDVTDLRRKDADANPKVTDRKNSDVENNRIITPERKIETEQKREIRIDSEKKNDRNTNNVSRERSTVNDRQNNVKKETVNRDNSSDRKSEKREVTRDNTSNRNNEKREVITRDNSSERKDDREKTTRKR